jgi:surface antigen
MRKIASFFGIGALALTMMAPAAAQAQFWQCVPYARQISGVEIRGNAHTWWGQAEGRYARGTVPREGAVMAFKSNRAMPLGHVAVVRQIVSDREVLLDHANWSRGGKIEHGVRAIDVSDAGDWSAVKVWFGPIGDLGTRVNPVAGFIYPEQSNEIATPRPRYASGPLIGQDVIQLAALELTSSR